MTMITIQIIEKEIDFLIENIDNYNNEEIKKRLLLIKDIINIANNEIITLPTWGKEVKKWD